MMRVCIVFPKSVLPLFSSNVKETFGGADVFLYQLSEEMMKQGIVELDGIVVSSSNSLDKVPKGMNVIRSFSKEDQIISKLWKFAKAFLDSNADVFLQTGLTPYSGLLASLCHLRGKRFVFRVAHDVESLGYYQESRSKANPLSSKVLKVADLVIVSNKEQKRNLKFNDNVTLIEKGIARPQMGLSRESSYDAIWVARCVRWKNPESFIRLAERNPKNSFCMVCPPVKGQEEYYKSIRNKASEYSNINFFSFCKYSEVLSLFRNSRLLVLTSDKEGFPSNTIIEAISHGLPILSLNIDSDIFGEEGCGVFSKSNEDILRFNFKKLTEDKFLYRKISKNSIKLFHERFDIKICARNYAKNFLKLVEFENI